MSRQVAGVRGREQLGREEDGGREMVEKLFLFFFVVLVCFLGCSTTSVHWEGLLIACSFFEVLVDAHDWVTSCR